MGPVEFRGWKKRLERINEMLGLSEVEKTFQRPSLGRRNEDEQREAEKENLPFRPMSAGEQAGYQRRCSQVLRCHVAQTLMGEDFRGFSCRLSESQLLRWFCKLDRLEGVRIPGKSTLQRYSQWLPEADMRKVIDTLLAAATGKDESGRQPLELAAGLNLESYFPDTTGVRLNIHFPVDWVLWRDAARTLMKATILIRQRGLKVRMEEPEEFLKRMNRLCMKMTHARRKKDARRVRKAVPREMKKLSLYEGHAAVYVRGKAGAEVEFGSQLLPGESPSGVIVDWELVDGNPQADTKMLSRSLERIKDGKFVELQTRRWQTEARISILKNGFPGSLVLSKGQANQEREVVWNVLAHNLWGMARPSRAKAQPKALAQVN